MSRFNGENPTLSETGVNWLHCWHMRVAIVHYWLLRMRGGERVVEALCRLFPEADIYTLFYEPEQVSPLIRSHRVTASFLNPLRRHYRALLPAMPLALEAFDLSSYELVISSESGPAKGVLTRSDTRHICYCHTPMRYLWDLYPQYAGTWTPQRCKRIPAALCSNYLRMWDYCSAARVDKFVANSENVRRRIQKTYRRDAETIHPPVAIERFHWMPAQDYFLVISELVPYKQIDLAVSVFTRTQRRLCIVGDGPEFKKLKRSAGPTVQFMGRVSDADVSELLARCRALIMPGEEDFGIVAVEALASGKPVIGLRRGGLVEIVSSNELASSFLFNNDTEADLTSALLHFEQREEQVEPLALQRMSAEYSEAEFARKMKAATEN